MHAAVVTRFDGPPRFQEFADPEERQGGVVLDVVAAGLHPRVRSQADGSHYTSTDELPLIPGIDGVGRGRDGELRYFVLPDTSRGSMAEKVLVDPRRSVVLPADCDPVAVAAGMNPAMSSWVALRRRIAFQAGRSVLVLGATGSAGRMAVQVAQRLGASTVFATGRNEGRLAEASAQGATTVPLTEPGALARAADVDVVLDYLWGQPAADAMSTLVTARADRGRRLDWLQIGSVAGPEAPVPSAALRASGLTILGSGQGSVDTRDILAELPEIAAALTEGVFTVNARTVSLADVEQAWAEAALTSDRLVVVPG